MTRDCLQQRLNSPIMILQQQTHSDTASKPARYSYSSICSGVAGSAACSMNVSRDTVDNCPADALRMVFPTCTLPLTPVIISRRYPCLHLCPVPGGERVVGPPCPSCFLLNHSNDISFQISRGVGLFSATAWGIGGSINRAVRGSMSRIFVIGGAWSLLEKTKMITLCTKRDEMAGSSSLPREVSRLP